MRRTPNWVYLLVCLVVIWALCVGGLHAQENNSQTLADAEREKSEAFSEYTRLVTVGGEGDPQAALERYRSSHARVEELKARAQKTEGSGQSAPGVSDSRVRENLEPTGSVAAGGGLKGSNQTLEIGVEAPLGAVDWSKVDIFNPGAAKIAHEWLGWLAQNGGIDRIIQPRNHIEFFNEMGKLARSFIRDNKKISRIVISGHGSPTQPGIVFEKAIVPNHVDIVHVNKLVSEKREQILGLKEKLYASEAGISELSADELKSLQGELKPAQSDHDMNLQFLYDMEHVSLAMAENAMILLAVCYQSRTPEHEAFSKSFGEAFLSISGGAVISARTAFALDRGNLIVNYWKDVFGIEEEQGQIGMSTKGWWHDYYNNGVSPSSSQMTWFTSNWTVTRIDKLNRTISPLKVGFAKNFIEVGPQENRELTPIVEAFPDSGQLTYRWKYADKSSDGEVFYFEAPKEAVGLQKVDLVVRDSRGREGFGRLFVHVAKPPQSTSVESGYTFAVGDISGGPSSQGVVRFKHSWSEPPQELVPGQPFAIDLQLQELDRRMPADAIIIGEMRFSVGVMVTAGRDWIDNFIKNDKPSRKQGPVYDTPSPSPQLYLGEYLVAGYLSDFDPSGMSVSKWLQNAQKRFTAPVPALIPNKDTYEVPRSNISGEQLLIIIYAMGSGGSVYSDSNFLYESVSGAGGTQVWRLVRQWNTADKEWKAPDNSSSAWMR